MDKALKPWLIALTVISIIFTLLFATSVIINFNYTAAKDVHWESTGQVGDFFGGIVGTFVAGIGSLLLYITFKSQQKENINSQIESRFFELLKLHKDNLMSISYENMADERNPDLSDRKAIQFILGQVESCFREISRFFENRPLDVIYQDQYLKKSKDVLQGRNSLDLALLAQIDIAYSIVFYGLSRKDYLSLQKLFVGNYKVELTEPILRYLRMKSLGDDSARQFLNLKFSKIPIDDLISDLNILANKGSVQPRDDDSMYSLTINKLWKGIMLTNKYYGGHQYKLGHYFRHLFQTVKYINTITTLTYAEKYDYVKTLRAQLSTVEQYLFFLNSISFMGRAWELEHVVKDVSDYAINKWLITKYNFIKNIPDLTLFDKVYINDFYPQVHYEFEQKPDGAAELLKKFEATETIKINK